MRYGDAKRALKTTTLHLLRSRLCRGQHRPHTSGNSGVRWPRQAPRTRVTWKFACPRLELQTDGRLQRRRPPCDQNSFCNFAAVAVAHPRLQNVLARSCALAQGSGRTARGFQREDSRWRRGIAISQTEFWQGKGRLSNNLGVTVCCASGAETTYGRTLHSSFYSATLIPSLTMSSSAASFTPVVPSVINSLTPNMLYRTARCALAAGASSVHHAST